MGKIAQAPVLLEETRAALEKAEPGTPEYYKLNREVGRLTWLADQLDDPLDLKLRKDAGLSRHQYFKKKRAFMRYTELSEGDFTQICEANYKGLLDEFKNFNSRCFETMEL